MCCGIWRKLLKRANHENEKALSYDWAFLFLALSQIYRDTLFHGFSQLRQKPLFVVRPN
ncbi:MAG: hypothetical protein ACJAZ1_003375 [Yoonia sp.]|jgi:hypothetical protein